MRLLNAKTWEYNGVADYFRRDSWRIARRQDAQLMSSAEAIMQDALMQIRCMLDRQVCGNCSRREMLCEGYTACMNARRIDIANTALMLVRNMEGKQ